MERYIKAIAAFVSALLIIFIGDETSRDINVGDVETLIIAILTAAGVAVSPANRAPVPRQ